MVGHLSGLSAYYLKDLPCAQKWARRERLPPRNRFRCLSYSLQSLYQWRYSHLRDLHPLLYSTSRSLHLQILRGLYATRAEQPWADQSLDHRHR